MFTHTHTLKILAKSLLVLAVIGGVSVSGFMVTEAAAKTITGTVKK